MRGQFFPPFASLLLSTVLIPVSAAVAQSVLDQAIAARFPPTIATADRTDIVTAGAVMTLKKSGIIMFATNASSKAQMTYKDGKLSPTVTTRMAAFTFTGQPATVVQRTYVQNEKLWLIDVKDANDGVVLQLLSDAVGDVRFTGWIKFPFPKGKTPAPEEVIGQIAQVMAPDGGVAPAVSPVAPPPPIPAPTPPPALPPIAPPPPPADMPAAAPPTLEKGQTRDQVVAGFGQPARVVKIGAKEIDYYKDMKVTYVNGKVSNIE